MQQQSAPHAATAARESAPLELDAEAAQRLVDSIATAGDAKAANAALEAAFYFLLAQLQLLRVQANGYPRNPIEGKVWAQGHELAQVCDRYADAAEGLKNRRAEAQGAGLAVTMALQVVGHYPEEIFPRVLRAGRCDEGLGASHAVDSYRCIVGDFVRMGLEKDFDDSEPLQESELIVLQSLRGALEGLVRLQTGGLTEEQRALQVRAEQLLAAEGAG